jgi:hypothetical protein
MFVDATEFTIERSKWSFGKGKDTKILRENGLKDCLGFFLLASGFKEEHLLNVDEPLDLTKNHEWLTKLIEWSGGTCFQSLVCIDIIQINDHKALEDSVRESKLIKLFESIGVKLTFVD